MMPQLTKDTGSDDVDSFVLTNFELKGVKDKELNNRGKEYF